MRLSTLLPLMGLFAVGYAKECPKQRTSPGKEILCYTASNNADELLDAICKCTTLVHQGHQLHNLSISGVEELQKTLKEMNAALQVVVSVTDPQGTLRTSATTRQEASGRLANLLSQVDGVELEMTAGSKERLSHFVKGLKDEMIRKSNEKRIILALPTKPEELAKQYDLKTLSKYVDLFTLSTHYLVDDAESFNTFHPSRLMGIFDMLNTDSLVDLVSGMGVPKKKLLVSVPASAYKFTLMNEEKTVPGSSVKEEEPTAISQKELCDIMSAGEWTVERDTDLTAPYAFKDSTWIAYEDKTSVGIKGKYILLRELAGLGVHDIENDVENDCGKPVTYEVYRSFTDMKRKTRGAVLASLENDLQHEQMPKSRHIRSSEFRIVRVVDTAGAIHAIRENTQTEFICTRQGYFVHPKSCNRFYRCVKFDQGVDDYSVFEFDCPAGLAFDERTEVCVWPGSLTEGSPCPGSSEIAPVPRARFQCPERDGYYADPQNCRWFFACFNLGEPEPTAYEFRCPFGLVFDEQKLICEWPWLVPGCGVSGYSRTEYGGSGSEYATNLHGHGSGSGQGLNVGGIGFGGYSGSGIGAGISGQYAAGTGSSSYPGSKPSESRQSESGTGAGGFQFAGHGASGSQYDNSGQEGHGYTGSVNFGAGNGGSIYSGASGIGNSGSGSRLRYDAANNGHSGSATVIGVNAGSGTGIYGKGVGSTVSGGYSGSGYGGSNYAGVGATNTLYSGTGSDGLKYSNQREFGVKYPSSVGSGSSHSEYSGQTGSTSAYNGLGKTGVVIETQGHDSPIYSTVTAGNGHSAANGYTGSSGSSVNAAGNKGYNGFGSTATNYQGFSGNNQGSGKDGLTVSLQTGGSHGGSTGSDHGSNSGYYIANQAGTNGYSTGGTGSVYSGAVNNGYVTSGGSESDAQDVINGGSHSGSSILTGTTGNAYIGGSGTRGSYTKYTSNGLNQALNVFGVKKPGTSAPGILVQTVTPGYSVTGSGISHGTVYGGSGTSGEHSDGGAYVTGSGYGAGNTGSGNVVVDHGSNYNGGYVSGTQGSDSGHTLVNSGAGHEGGNVYVETGSSSTVSDIGKGGISTGTTTYHGNGGSSSSYLSSKTNTNTNSNSHADSSTVFSHNDASGVVITGNADQGSVYGGISRPGYVKINPATSGHTVHEITQTTYGNTVPGTFPSGTPVPSVVVTGTAAPGVILHGTSDSGAYLTGQTHEGAIFEGSSGHAGGVTGTTTYHGNAGSSGYVISTGSAAGVSHEEVGAGFVGSTGSDFGSKTTYVGTAASNSNQDTGYKTNEYDSNGGRGTVTFNNGYSASKYTESDIRDRQPAYASLPDTIVSGGRIENSGGVVLGNTLAGINSHVTHGFTKTGPTKTGFTTAQIGGSGSYVTNTGYSHPTQSPGINIFEGQKSGEGYSVGTSIGNDVNNLAYVTSTVSSDLSHIDASKIDLGHTSSDSSSGYAYKKPTVPFVTGSITASTPTPLSVTYHEPIVPLTVTTPSPYFKVETVYNTPSIVTSAPITAAPAVVNTYSYRRPTAGSVSSGYKYRRPTQTVTYQSSDDAVQQTTAYQQPINFQKHYTVTPTTPAPVAYATGPAEVYKSTLFEAAKQPITVSTVAPVFDTGYKTVVSSTAAPIAVSTGKYFYSDSRFTAGSLSGTGQTPGHLDITYQQPEVHFQKEYVSSTSAPSTGGGYTYEKPRKQLTYNSPSTVSPSVTIYDRPEVTIKQQVKYVSQSTIGTDFGGQYDKPSASIRPAFNKPSTFQTGYSVVSTAAPVSNSQGYDYSKPAIKFVTSTPAPVYTESQGSSYVHGGSPTKLNIYQKEIKKLVDNVDRGGLRYTPPDIYVDGNTGNLDSGNTGFGNKAFGHSVTSKTYEATTPDSIIRGNTYGGYASSTGSYTSGYKTGRYPTTPLYEVSTVKPAVGKGKGKVIVKLSDLHPLLLGKLGAQCTCRSDPFETLRGPGAKIVKSSRGDVDLAQYDESQIYVDLESDDQPNHSAALYNAPTASSTLSPSVYSSSFRTPVTAVFGLSTPVPTVFRSRGKPSTAYLPVSSTPSPISKSRGGPSSHQVIPLESGAYEASSDNLDPQYINLPAGFVRGDVPVGRSAGGKIKSGKSLGGSAAAGNAIGGAGAAFDRYGPGGLRGVDETLQGGADCARPGLFRHPKFCNKFYACHWDEWKQKYTLHVFNCPVHLSFDTSAGACNWPSKGPACQDDNLLV